jgi:site-specific recombinase XerD
VLPDLPEWENGTQAQITRDFCKSIGISSVKFHNLRATFITQMLMRGVPLAQVMSIVGHNQLKTTNTYLRVIGTDLAGATEKLSYSLPANKLAELVDISGIKR